MSLLYPLIFIAALFGLLPPNLFHGDPAKLLMPFLGLFMAGIFPAISLTVNSVKSGGYSVNRIDSLSQELNKLLNYLQALFLIALVGALTIVSGEILKWGSGFPFEFYTSRIFNIILGLALGALISSLPRIRSTFSILLNIATEIAKDEAINKIRNSASKLAPVSSRFPVRDDFGATLTVPRPDDEMASK